MLMQMRRNIFALVFSEADSLQPCAVCRVLVQVPAEVYTMEAEDENIKWWEVGAA